MTGWVYILRSDTDILYVGSTENISRRLKQHKKGQTRTTNKFENFSLAFSQKFENIADARLIEKRLKKLKRRDYLEKIIKDGYIKMN